MLRNNWPDLDCVEEFDATSLVAIRNIAMAEDFFEHHFPGKPLVPAVLILSWIEHAAGVLICFYTKGSLSAVFRKIEKASCLRPATPGNSLKISVKFPVNLTELKLYPGLVLDGKSIIYGEGSQLFRVRFQCEVTTLDTRRYLWEEIKSSLKIS